MKMAGSIEKSTDVMKAMQSLIRVSEIQQSMMDLSKEMSKVGFLCVFAVFFVCCCCVFFFVGGGGGGGGGGGRSMGVVCVCMCVVSVSIHVCACARSTILSYLQEFYC